jgi:hypothetical protein
MTVASSVRRSQSSLKRRLDEGVPSSVRNTQSVLKAALSGDPEPQPRRRPIKRKVRNSGAVVNQTL